MNLSFAGCGFLGIYHVGVAVCFKKYAPHLLLDKISGASAGAIAACCLLCDLPLGTITSNVIKLSKEARRKTLGPFSPSFNVQAILLDSLQKYLPEDAHVRVSGKLHISLTRVYDGKNVIVSHFHSREDLLQALLASSFIPLFSGLLPPRFHGIRYMDGGFSDNLPTLNENTITISPFCGESDICPRDISSQLFHVNFANTSIELSRQNIYRFVRILFPPNPEILSNMCKQGFDDALRFLHRNNLINCTRCLAIQSTFVVSETLDESMEYDPECIECKIHRQEALVANLPETVMTIFQDAIDSANRGIVNWLFKHKSIKVLSLLSLPYTLPVDIICTMLNKMLMNAPKLRNHLMEIITYLLEQICLMLQKINIYNQTIRQIITCQVAIGNYDSSNSHGSFFEQGTSDTTATHLDNHPSWQESSCIINIKEISLFDNTFENILQVTSDEETIMAYYHMDENKIIEDPQNFNIPERPANAAFSMEQQLAYHEIFWDEPEILAQRALTDAIQSYNENTLLKNDQLELYSSLNDNEKSDRDLNVSSNSVNDESNIFSDPESEWEMSTHELPATASSTTISTTITTATTSTSTATTSTNNSRPADSRPEVDQPIRQIIL